MSTVQNPALVLNADFRPLSYYPLSLCSWQDAIKAVFLERVSVIESYNDEVKRIINIHLGRPLPPGAEAEVTEEVYEE